MKRVAITLIYIILVSTSANVIKNQGNPTSTAATFKDINQKEVPQKAHFLPMIFASGPVQFLPEPATVSLFGFGLLLIIGLGWIKKAPERNQNSQTLSS